jgi:hypothetical protein
MTKFINTVIALLPMLYPDRSGKVKGRISRRAQAIRRQEDNGCRATPIRNKYIETLFIVTTLD